MRPTFGIYIKTFKPDHYLAKVLIASIRHYAPGVEIMLVPDDGFTRDRLWGEKVLNTDDPFLVSLKGYYKKLWVFFGPYDRFIYLDADMLLVRPLDALIHKLMRSGAPSCHVCAESKCVAALARADDEARDAIYRNTVGDPELFRVFDPDYVMQAHFPFNSGFFASHREVVSRDALEHIMLRVNRIHAQRGLPPLNNTRKGVFYSDQGLINYLMYKNGIDVTLLTEAFVWGGREVPDMTEDVRGDPLKHLFVHWAGCPRPTFANRDVPAGKEWIRFYYDYYANRPYLTFLRDTAVNICGDVYWRGRKRLSSVKRRLVGRTT